MTETIASPSPSPLPSPLSLVLQQPLRTKIFYGPTYEQFCTLLIHMSHNANRWSDDTSFLIEWIQSHPAMDTEWKRSAMTMVCNQINSHVDIVRILDALKTSECRSDIRSVRWLVMTHDMIRACTRHQLDMGPSAVTCLYNLWQQSRPDVDGPPAAQLSDHDFQQLHMEIVERLVEAFPLQTCTDLWEPHTMDDGNMYSLHQLLCLVETVAMVVTESYRHWARCYEGTRNEWRLFAHSIQFPEPLFLLVGQYMAAPPFLFL